MKGIWWCISFVMSLVLGLSCSNSRVDTCLYQSRKLMSSQPDSALYILNTLDTDMLYGKARRAEYSLLLSMALDKNYIDETNDSIISVAYNYYQRHGSKKDKMLSSYYLGIVRENAGSSIDAAIAFDQALSFAKDIEDNHYCGMACKHLCTIHSNNYNHYHALEYARLTVSYFENCNESLSADYGRLNVAQQLLRNYCYDDALEILDKLIATNDYAPLVRNAYMVKAEALVYGERDYAGALSAINQIQTVNPSVALMIYGLKSFLLEATGDFREANRYLDIAEGYVETAIDSLTILDQRARIYEMRGNYKEALNSYIGAMNIQNRQITALLAQSVTSAMEEHYRQSLKEEEERSYRKSIVFVFCGIIMAIVLFILVYVIRKQRLSRIQDMADIDALNQDIFLLRQRNDQFRKVSNLIIKDRIQGLQQLSDVYFEWSDEQIKKREALKGRETRDEILLRFQRTLGDLRSDSQIYTSIEDAVNLSMDNIVKKAREACGEVLKEDDYRILALMYSGLSIKSIAFLLKTSEPALRTRKTRYKQFFDTLDHPCSHLFADALYNTNGKR